MPIEDCACSPATGLRVSYFEILLVLQNTDHGSEKPLCRSVSKQYGASVMVQERSEDEEFGDDRRMDGARARTTQRKLERGARDF